MEFDKSRVYTALNADELKVGSKVFAANSINALKRKVNDEDEYDILEVKEILEECYERRFQLDHTGTYPFVYLVSEPEEKKLKWTDLKIGDGVRHKVSEIEYLVTGIDKRKSTTRHINFSDTWVTDDNLGRFWEKVEE